FFQAEDGIRDFHVTGVQTCALPISHAMRNSQYGSPRTTQQRSMTVPIESNRVGTCAQCPAAAPHAKRVERGAVERTTRWVGPSRSEERRVGKECGGRCVREIEREKQ